MKHKENLKMKDAERLKKLKEHNERQHELAKLDLIREAAKKEGMLFDAQTELEIAHHLILSALNEKASDDLSDLLSRI